MDTITVVQRIKDLAAQGAFTPEQVKEVREALSDNALNRLGRELADDEPPAGDGLDRLLLDGLITAEQYKRRRPAQA